MEADYYSFFQQLLGSSNSRLSNVYRSTAIPLFRVKRSSECIIFVSPHFDFVKSLPFRVFFFFKEVLSDNNDSKTSPSSLQPECSGPEPTEPPNFASATKTNVEEEEPQHRHTLNFTRKRTKEQSKSRISVYLRIGYRRTPVQMMTVCRRSSMSSL